MNEYHFNYYQYNKRLNKNLKINFIIIIIIFIILFLTVSILLKPTQKTFNFYFVEIDNFQTYSKAYNIAEEIKKQQGAGYIYYEQNYKVLATYFSEKKDAETVVNNLKENYPNSQVYILQINQNLKLNNLSKKQIDIVKTLQQNLFQITSILSNSSILLDKQELKFNNFIFQFKEVLKNLNKDIEKFYNLFNQNPTFNHAKDCLKNIELSVNNLSKTENDFQLGQIIKFEMVHIVINFANFSNCFN